MERIETQLFAMIGVPLFGFEAIGGALMATIDQPLTASIWGGLAVVTGIAVCINIRSSIVLDNIVKKENQINP